MALQTGLSGGGFKPEDLGVSTTQNFTAGTGKIPALIDAWGNPLAFIRWPAASPDLNPGGAQAGYNNDSSDPDGTFTIASWQTTGGMPTANYTNFQTTFGYTPPARGTGAALSFKLVPILVSAGPDQSLGSYGTISAASFLTPIQITSKNHGLSTGQTVTVNGVQGNTAANGTWVITKVDGDNFQLNGSAGNGTYTAAGNWSTPDTNDNLSSAAQ
jgi:hypothetical protein